MIVPDGLPVLGGGYHAHPAQGACLMEYASLLAGLEWSDRPKCVYFPLTGVSQRTNDDLSDSSRQRLLPLVPRVLRITPERVGALKTEDQRSVEQAVTIFSQEQRYLNECNINLETYKLRREGWIRVNMLRLTDPTIRERQYHDHSDALLVAVGQSFDDAMIELYTQLLGDLERLLGLPRLDAPDESLMTRLYDLHDEAKRTVRA